MSQNYKKKYTYVVREVKITTKTTKSVNLYRSNKKLSMKRKNAYKKSNETNSFIKWTKGKTTTLCTTEPNGPAITYIQ